MPEQPTVRPDELTRIYGRDRLFVAVSRCPLCQSDHPQMEFKHQGGDTYKARCVRAKEFLTLPLTEVARLGPIA